MALETPASNATLLQPFTLSGWAIDLGGTSGTGVDTVHVWAYPASGAPRFVGVATYGLSRSDIGSTYGARFTNSGYSLSVTGLSPGAYTLVAFAYSNVAASFNQAQTVAVTLPSSFPAMAIGLPASGSSVGSTFPVSGWAIDRLASSGTGVDAIHVWAFPTSGASPTFVGQAAYGAARSDVGALFGSQFTNSGFSMSASLPVGSYRFVVYAHSSVSGTFNNAQVVLITVAGAVPIPAMAVDGPAAGSTQTRPFGIDGWAVDLGASSGPGVDAIHVYAFPVVGGSPSFLGVASYGVARPDVGAVFGSAFTNSGYHLAVTSGVLAAGQYDVTVYARSTVSGTFNQARVVRVTVQ
jgi:hypothetical protein